MNSINITDNYIFSGDITEQSIIDKYIFSDIKKKKDLSKINSFSIDINPSQNNNIKVFSFNKNRKYNDNSKVINVIRNDKNLNIETFNYSGIVLKDNFRFNINSRFGNNFLKRMLNFLDDVFIQESDFFISKSNDDFNSIQLIIFYLFIQSLNKALIIGLPSEYIKTESRENILKGNLDINNYIKKDIPFTGLISSTYKERKPVEIILRVIFKALNIIILKKPNLINTSLKKILNELKIYSRNSYITKDDIRSAKNHKSLSNPIYNKYKDVLSYAELIINNNGFNLSDSLYQGKSIAYLFDISELFEIYIEKLLKKSFPDYKLYSQYEIEIYQDTFFKRKMIPDFVLENENKKIIVLDAKYKKMKSRYFDLDREDFYQIHTYMSYFSYSLIGGGLIYPIEDNNFNYENISQPLFGKQENKSKFFISGIKLKEDITFNEILEAEKDFCNSIKNMVNQNS